jgi:hypothetical protein
MLVAIHPIPLESITVWPRVDTPTMLFVEVILTFIRSSIRPFIYSLEVHKTVLPLSAIAPLISPNE